MIIRTPRAPFHSNSEDVDILEGHRHDLHALGNKPEFFRLFDGGGVVAGDIDRQNYCA
jgi:hypothetical protein